MGEIVRSDIFLVVYYHLTLFDIPKNLIKSLLTFWFISQISVHSLWHVCICMQYLMKIYHVVQELWAFSLTDHGRRDRLTQ